jgi:hypothetical protein
MNCVTKGNVRGKAGVRTPVAKGELANSLADEDLTETPAQVLHIVVLLQARGAHAQAKLAVVVVLLDYADWHRGVVPGEAARLLNPEAGAIAAAEDGDALPSERYAWIFEKNQCALRGIANAAFAEKEVFILRTKVMALRGHSDREWSSGVEAEFG